MKRATSARQDDSQTARQIQLSKAIAHALRHDPSAYGLEIDDEGWVPVDHLLAALNRNTRWRGVTREELVEVAHESPKRRYEIHATRIRALYGHSIATRIRNTAAEPPPELFHGTARSVVPEIELRGLRPMRRQYVHLSVDVQTAVTVGRRRDPQPVVLRVAAAAAHEAGVTFLRGNDEVWLTEHVPPSFVRRCSDGV